MPPPRQFRAKASLGTGTVLTFRSHLARREGHRFPAMTTVNCLREFAR